DHQVRIRVDHAFGGGAGVVRAASAGTGHVVRSGRDGEQWIDAGVTAGVRVTVFVQEGEAGTRGSALVQDSVVDVIIRGLVAVTVLIVCGARVVGHLRGLAMTNRESRAVVIEGDGRPGNRAGHGVDHAVVLDVNLRRARGYRQVGCVLDRGGDCRTNGIT